MYALSSRNLFANVGICRNNIQQQEQEQQEEEEVLQYMNFVGNTLQDHKICKIYQENNRTSLVYKSTEKLMNVGYRQ